MFKGAQNNLYVEKYFEKILRFSLMIFFIFLSLQLMSCEDDALLQPELIKECKPGESYCNLSLPKSSNYASINFSNPEIF